MFPALYSAASPVFITCNITVIFIIDFVLMSSSPNLKPATFCERVCMAENPVPFLSAPKEFYFLESSPE